MVSAIPNFKIGAPFSIGATWGGDNLGAMMNAISSLREFLLQLIMRRVPWREHWADIPEEWMTGHFRRKLQQWNRSN